MSKSKMNYRLGLDLGTNSIGWAVLSLDENSEIDGIQDMGVRIFSDGRDPKTKEPLAVKRRTARGIRRNLYRKKLRRRQLFRLLQKAGLMPASPEEARLLKTADPYLQRKEALDRYLEPYELGRALFHLGVRRGFKSNRKIGTETVEPKEGACVNDAKVFGKEKFAPDKMNQAEKSEYLNRRIAESGCRTLGEFLFRQRENGGSVRFAPERTLFYPTRKLYEEEFEAIRSFQQKAYPDVCWDEIHSAIFYQRPLRLQERGDCPFYPNEKRTFKAMPCSQRFRILREVLSLEYFDGNRKEVKPTRAQQDLIIGRLERTKEVKFDDIRKLLKIDGDFTPEAGGRDKLKGNTTAYELRKKSRFGELWDTFSLREQDEIVSVLIEADEDEKVMEMLSRYPQLSDEQKDNIVHLVLPAGTSGISARLTEELVVRMDDCRQSARAAMDSLGFRHTGQTVEEYERLPYYGQILTGSTVGGNGMADEPNPEKKYGKIANPTVHVLLNQLRHVVNALIHAYGKPVQISLELSRELKTGCADKIRRDERKENEKNNDRLNQAIREVQPGLRYPNRPDRLKYKLWEELGEESFSRRCLYCGKVIPAADLFSSTSETEIGFILPFGRTLMNSESNLTLAHRRCNAFKGNRSPYEAFGSSPSGYDWQAILARVDKLASKKKKQAFSEGAMNRFGDESSFIKRQLSDNAYFSRIILRYLKSVCPQTWAVNGGMTAFLRNRWNSDSLIKRRPDEKPGRPFRLGESESDTLGKKECSDYRHHALDALVIGLTDSTTVLKQAQLNRTSFSGRVKIEEFPFSRDEVTERLKKIVVSFKPDHGWQAQLTKETLLGKIRRPVTIPTGGLKEDRIADICQPAVKEEWLKCIEEAGTFKKAKKRLEEKYPQSTVWETFFVVRSPLTSMTKREQIEKIIDEKIKKDLYHYLDTHPDLSADKAIAAFGEERHIQRVRIRNHDRNPVCYPAPAGKPSAADRYYGADSYLCAVIWEEPPQKEGGKAKYKGQFVRYDQVGGDGKLPGRSADIHPAAGKVCVLYKDDYIEFLLKGVWRKGRITGFSASDNRLDVSSLYAVGNLYSWQNGTAESLLEPEWTCGKGHNYIGIETLFGKSGAHRITVSPIGRVFGGL